MAKIEKKNGEGQGRSRKFFIEQMTNITLFEINIESSNMANFV